MGWNARVHADHSGGQLLLHSLPAKVRLFEYREGETAAKTDFFPPGTGFVLRKGQQLGLRFQIANSGPDSMTHGASVLIYFVPVQGN
jgi:hypothetical protein